MLYTIMKYVFIFYCYTWFVWPFVFVYGLSAGIAAQVKGEKSWGLLLASVALLLMLTGIMGSLSS